MEEIQNVSPENKPLPPPNPVTQKAHRRETWLQILLPVIVALLITAGFIYWIVLNEWKDLKVLAQVGQVLMILPTFVLGLVLLALLVAGVFAVTYVLRILPPYARMTQDAIDNIKDQAVSGADLSAKPIIQIRSFIAMIEVLLGKR